jgi:hypothetical protein
MPTIVTCPDETCGRQLRVPDELLGKSVKCPKCGKIFTAREDTGAPPPAPARPQPAAEEEEYEREEEEERRPARRRSVARDDDDDYDDRPRRRRRRRDYAPHRGTMILVFGILSLVVLPIVFGPIAWIMGNQDMAEIRAGRMDPEGEGSTNAGRVCGIIGTILGIVGCVCVILYFIFIASIVAGAGAGGRFR